MTIIHPRERPILMSNLGKIQYREAVEALKKLEPWRLAEIRREFNIPEPMTRRLAEPVAWQKP
jgi:hypothetical protein